MFVVFKYTRYDGFCTAMAFNENTKLWFTFTTEMNNGLITLISFNEKQNFCGFTVKVVATVSSLTYSGVLFCTEQLVVSCF